MEGEEIQKKPHFYTSTDLSKILSLKENLNTTVTIIYDKNEPVKFTLKDESSANYIGLVFLLIIGFGFITIGILNLLGQINF